MVISHASPVKVRYCNIDILYVSSINYQDSYSIIDCHSISFVVEVIGLFILVGHKFSGSINLFKQLQPQYLQELKSF